MELSRSRLPGSVQSVAQTGDTSAHPLLEPQALMRVHTCTGALASSRSRRALMPGRCGSGMRGAPLWCPFPMLRPLPGVSNPGGAVLPGAGQLAADIGMQCLLHIRPVQVGFRLRVCRGVVAGMHPGGGWKAGCINGTGTIHKCPVDMTVARAGHMRSQRGAWAVEEGRSREHPWPSNEPKCRTQV